MVEEESGNIGLIIGVIVAVLAIIAVVVVIVIVIIRRKRRNKDLNGVGDDDVKLQDGMRNSVIKGSSVGGSAIIKQPLPGEDKDEDPEEHSKLEVDIGSDRGKNASARDLMTEDDHEDKAKAT